MRSFPLRPLAGVLPLAILLAGAVPAVAAIPQVERDALIALYSATNGAGWVERTNWRDATDTDFSAAGTECTWFGVSCTEDRVSGLTLAANGLVGSLPADLVGLDGLAPGGMDLRWNAVHAADATLVAFLDSRQAGGDWQGTQTVAVSGLGLAAGRPAASSVLLSWTPIAYGADGGGYRIYSGPDATGPWTLRATTASKMDAATAVTGLEQNTTYHFVVESVTDPHAGNPNPVVSERTAPFAARTPDFGLRGWATENGGTTGGAGGAEVVVNTLDGFKIYASSPDPYVIYVYGTIVGDETVRVGSNKSILGVGSNARFLGVGLTIGWSTASPPVSNVIVRNIAFEKVVGKDAITIGYARNVWIDHCDFSSDRLHGVDYYDGLVDVNHASDYVTISWNRLSEHYKTSLVGHSDDNAVEDSGHLTVTYHHNSFVNSGGRNPSVRFGLVHVFNNHYLDIDDYAIASRQNAQVVIENNWFENVNRPIRADTSLSPVAGFVRGVDTNAFVNCTASSITTPPATWVPPYAYSLDPLDDLPVYVGWWAGVGVVTWTADSPPNPLTLSTSGAGTVAADPSPGPYPPGTVVTLTAAPDGGNFFTHWSGDLTGNLNPTTITMDAPKSVTAHFAPIVSGLRLNVSSIGSGSVTRDPDQVSYESGTQVTLTAVPASGGSFVEWSGDCSGSATTCELTMDSDKSVTATFTVVAASTYLHDIFADGERSTQLLPESAHWMSSSGSSSLTVVANELVQAVTGTGSRTLLAYFTADQGAPVSLSAGQILELAFTFRMTGFDTGGNSYFRAALLRSVANPAATSGTGFVADGPPNTNARVSGDFGSNGPSNGPFALYTGYGAFTVVNDAANATPIRFYARTSANNTLLGSTTPYTQIPVGSPTASAAMAAGTSFRGRLRLLRTGSAVVLSYEVRQAADEVLVMSHTVTDDTVLAGVFDTAAFYVSKAAASADYDLVFSEVRVTRSAAYDLTVATAGAGTGSVASVPSGIECGSDCTGLFAQGTVVVLTATAAAGSVFTGWSGDCSGSASVCEVAMDGARSVTATFAPAYELTVSRAGTGFGSVTGDGIDCGGDCGEAYASGTVVTLTASPDAGSVFVGWSGDCTGAVATCEVTMDAARSVVANFSAAFRLTVSKEGTGAGVVSGVGLDCGGDCVEDFAAGTVVSLTATASAGSTFSGWGGDCAGVAACEVTMDAERSVTATFTEVPSTTFLDDAFADGERVTQGLPASAWWMTSSGSSNLTVVANELTQVVSASRTLLGYFTDDQGAPITLSAGQTLALDFTFRFNLFDTVGQFRAALLRSVPNPAATSGAGFVATGPPNTNARMSGDNFGNGPSYGPFALYTGYGAFSYANALGNETPVTFYARDRSNNTLLGGTGAFTTVAGGTPTPSAAMTAGEPYRGSLRLHHDGSGVVLDYQVVRVSDGAVATRYAARDAAASMTDFDTVAFYVGRSGTTTFNFVLSAVRVSRTTEYDLAVGRTGSGSGLVTSLPAGIECGEQCSRVFLPGTRVTLTATPAAGSVFTGWGGDCSGAEASCEVVMEGLRSVTAAFALEPRTLSVVKQGAGEGLVTSTPAGIDCGSSCTASFGHGTSVALAATPLAGSVFAGWGGDCASDGTITMDADRSCTAAFAPATVILGTRTKTVTGELYAGGSITYTITLTNTGTAEQADNPGPEVADALPAGVTLVSASATAGTVTADVASGAVAWNGILASGGSVTISIDATVEPTVALGTLVSNQAQLAYDADVDGTNEATALTDDPAGGGLEDPTEFVVASKPLELFVLDPCRILDTRVAEGPYGGPALAAGTERTFATFGRCGIPASARAIAVNLTVTGATTAGHLRLHPAGSSLPTTSSINYVAGVTRANNAVAILGGLGELAVYCGQASGTVHFILDVSGYFE